MDGGLGSECVNKKHVLEWTLTQLKAKNTSKVQDLMYDSDEEIEDSFGGEWIVENLCPCDNVVVPTTTNESFWLMFVE
jgi:hypothetical protein